VQATGAHGRGLPCGKACERKKEANERTGLALTLHWPLSQWRARGAVDPLRPIPNREVKHGSADGTGGRPAGRVGPRAIPREKAKGKKEKGFPLFPLAFESGAAWSSGSSSGS
jgi:hypothetical protein